MSDDPLYEVSIDVTTDMREVPTETMFARFKPGDRHLAVTFSLNGAPVIELRGEKPEMTVTGDPSVLEEMMRKANDYARLERENASLRRQLTDA